MELTHEALLKCIKRVEKRVEINPVIQVDARLVPLIEASDTMSEEELLTEDEYIDYTSSEMRREIAEKLETLDGDTLADIWVAIHDGDTHVRYGIGPNCEDMIRVYPCIPEPRPDPPGTPSWYR